MTTKWMSGDSKPTMEGVYQVRSADGLSTFWAFWDVLYMAWCVSSPGKRQAASFRGQLSMIQRKQWRGLEQDEFIEQVRNLPDERSQYEAHIRSHRGGGWQMLYHDMRDTGEALRYYQGAKDTYTNHDVKLVKHPKGEPHQSIVYEQQTRATSFIAKGD